MASLIRAEQSPINSSGQFLSLMRFGKPAVQYRNKSIADSIPQRYARLASLNLKKLSSNKKLYNGYKQRLLDFVTCDAVFLSYDDSELCNLSNILADRYQEFFSTETDWLTRFNAINKRLSEMSLPELKKPSKNSSYKSVCLRLTNIKFWRRTLRTAQSRILETEHVCMGTVGRNSNQLYVSNETLKRSEQKRLRNERLLESLEAENEEGYKATLKDLSDVSTSNPELRRNELMTRLRGLEEYADDNKLVGEFYTITCPSSMHRYSSIYKNNKYVRSVLNANFDGSSPRDSQAYLNKVWQKIRAELARHNLPLLGMRVSEPHHDGTPHWHMLFFINKEHRTQIRQIFRRYSLEVNSDEKGAQKHRFTAIKINKRSKSGKKQSAVGYIAKYIAKNLSFGNKSSKTSGSSDYLSTDSFENDGQSVTQSVNRVQAWASTWGIRQFQQIGGERITVWRELRRVRTNDKNDIPANFLPAHKAADSGNYSDFLKECLKHKIEIVKNFETIDNNPLVNIVRGDGESISYPDRELTNFYEELKPAPIIGLRILTTFMRTRAHEWRLKKRRVSVLGLVSITVPSN